MNANVMTRLMNAIILGTCFLFGSPQGTFAEGKDGETIEGKEEVIKLFQPFYVFTDENEQEGRFSPSGWMGDTNDLKVSGAYQENERLGRSCIKVAYTATGKKGWAGIYWQHPSNNWGDKKGGYDLRGARALTFWMKGERGGEKISEIKIGGLSGKIPDSDTAWTGPVKLTKDWKQYRIDLKGKDLRYIIGGFCFTVLKIDNAQGCTFYLDEIRYE